MHILITRHRYKPATIDDQLIKETTDRRIYWIHVSCRANKSKNRHQVIHFMQKGGRR